VLFTTREHDDGILRLAAGGELDVAALPDWERHLALADSTDGPVLVDLWDVTFCDSPSLRALLSAHERVTQAGRRFAVICDPSGPVQQLLNLTDTQHLLRPSATRPWAEQTLRNP
jgi:anti-anti-sigma factor